MKKSLHYPCIAIGCILGTLIGMWVIQRNRAKLLNVITRIREDVMERAEQIGVEARVQPEELRRRSEHARLPGDPTIDPPPPD